MAQNKKRLLLFPFKAKILNRFLVAGQYHPEYDWIDEAGASDGGFGKAARTKLSPEQLAGLANVYFSTPKALADCAYSPFFSDS